MVKLVDKPFNFLKWRYFSHTAFFLMISTTIVSFVITFIIWRDFQYYFYLYEQNWILRELIKNEYGWNYAFLYFIVVNSTLSLIFIVKTLLFRCMSLILILTKTIFSIFEYLFFISLIFPEPFIIYSMSFITIIIIFTIIGIWFFVSIIYNDNNFITMFTIEN